MIALVTSRDDNGLFLLLCILLNYFIVPRCKMDILFHTWNDLLMLSSYVLFMVEEKVWGYGIKAILTPFWLKIFFRASSIFDKGIFSVMKVFVSMVPQDIRANAVLM